MASLTADGWEIVQPKSSFNPELYDQLETIDMRACQVDIGEKHFSFCLEPRLSLDKEAKKVARACAAALCKNCMDCKSRVPKFARLIGEDGKHFAFCQEVSDPGVDKLREVCQTASPSKEVTDYQMIVVDGQLQAKYPTRVGDFDHVHFACDQLTPDDLAAKMKDLSAYDKGSFDHRFQKLVDDPASLEQIQNELPNLVRPDHWKALVTWAVKFVAKANGRTWSQLAAHEKFEVMVFAMLTGRSQGSVHFDMQQASNLVDFMNDAHNTAALRAMMDGRSDPETYQVSRVAELLRDKKVTSLCTVTLVWGMDGQPHKSDLDLHTKVGGQELYYSCKQVGKSKLDFDANASNVEKNPAENISLNQVGAFEFRVNNCNNRDNKDVPFQVIVKQPGFQEVHSGVWPMPRKSGEFLTVCTVVVTNEDLEEKPVELSETEQKKLANKEAEWERLFGEPTSVVVCEQDLEQPLVKCAAAQSSFSPPARGSMQGGAQAVFSQMLEGKANASEKPTLAERCQLETLSGFIKYVTDNECADEVNTRSFVPAYVTRIVTKTRVMVSGGLSINAFHRKNELPQQPRTDEQSMVRFDECWGGSARARVHGFAQIGKVWFMVLKDAHLPTDPAWPLGAGMYPTHLAPEVHHHRSKWASFHSLVTPTNPQSGTPLIGSALVGLPTFQFILNGREISVRSD